MNRYTLTVEPLYFYLGTGKPAPVPQGYTVNFIKDGTLFQSRNYGFSRSDEMLMFVRIANWVRDGEL